LLFIEYRSRYHKTVVTSVPGVPSTGARRAHRCAPALGLLEPASPRISWTPITLPIL
jgi:hypothetical protein